MIDALVAALVVTLTVSAWAGLRRPERAQVMAGLTGLLTLAAGVLVLSTAPDAALVVLLAIACLMSGVVGRAAYERRHDSPDDRLQRELARCRRRSEEASVLLVLLSDAAPPLRVKAIEALRITDAATARRVNKRWELHAVLDGSDVRREIVEHRLAASLATSDPTFGWATFPADGFTLEALLEHARAQICPSPPAGAATGDDVSSSS